jgi:hypothetical protein
VLLALQRSAGNAAVSRLLAREQGHKSGPGISKALAARLQARSRGRLARARLARAFDVHFDVRPPGGAAPDQTWEVVDAFADGSRPALSQYTMQEIQARQFEGGAVGIPAAAQDLRHVVPWEQFLMDAAAFGHPPTTLHNVATQIDAAWPASSVLNNPGIATVDEDDPRDVEKYAKLWVTARHDDPNNLFYGNRAQNISRPRGTIDQPTEAKGPARGNRSAFTENERTRLLERQLTALNVADGALDGAANNAISQWLTNTSTMSIANQGHVPQDTRANAVAFLMNQARFREIRLPALYND